MNVLLKSNTESYNTDNSPDILMLGRSFIVLSHLQQSFKVQFLSSDYNIF